MNKTILGFGCIVFVFFTDSNHHSKNYSLKDRQPKIIVTDCDHTKDGKRNTYDKSHATANHPVLKLVLSRQPVLIGCWKEARLHNDCDDGDTNHMYDGCLLDAHGGFCWCISSDKRHQCVCVWKAEKPAVFDMSRSILLQMRKWGKTCCLWQVLLKTSPTLHALASPSCVKKVVTNKWGKTETKRKEQRLLRGRQKARAPGRRTIDKPRSRSEGSSGGSTWQGLAWWKGLHVQFVSIEK